MATNGLTQQLVLGVEGGATKTEWIYFSHENDQWTVLQQGRLPAANFKLISRTDLKHLFELMPKSVTHVGLYLPGVMDSDGCRQLRDLAAEVWTSARISTGSDRESGLATALGHGSGIFVISGTGSAVTGRHRGRIEKAGGKGHLVGDQGSAYHVAIQGLRLLMDRYDEDQRPCKLGEAILQELCLNRVDDLIDWVHAADKKTVARLATTVFRVCQDGDEQLSDILKKGAESLAHSTKVVAHRLGISDPVVALHGSMFTKQGMYVSLFREALDRWLPGAKITICSSSGANGAARLAVDAGSESFIETEVKNKGHLNDEVESKRLVDMIHALTEQRNERSATIDQMTSSELVTLFVEEEKYVYEALKGCRKPLSHAIETVAASLQAGGHLFYVGAGTSGRLGMLDASEIPPTFGEPTTTVQGIIAGGPSALYRSIEGAEDDPVMGALAVMERGVTDRDVVCGITACGRTPYVLGALDKAKELGASTMLVTSNPNRAVKDVYGIEIVLITGPELVTGSTRLKAGTATKVALNIITTGAMVMLGRVRSNLMVSLKASNSKLQDRAARLVSQFTGCTYEEACEKLRHSAWDVRSLICEK